MSGAFEFREIVVLEPRTGIWWLYIVALLGVTALGVFLYRRDRRAAGARRGWVLTALRVLLFIFIATFIFDLADSRTIDLERLPEVLVVVDDSKSMSLDDSYRSEERLRADARAVETDDVQGRSRYELAKLALAGSFGEKLRERSKVTITSLSALLRDPETTIAAIRARGEEESEKNASDRETGANRDSSDRPTAAELPLLRSALPDEADFPSTTLLASFVEVATRRAGGNFGGFVLLSDGRHNTGLDPRGVAAELHQLDAPVLAVGIGADESPRDIRVARIDAPERVFAGDPIELEIILAAVGFSDARLRIDTVIDGERREGAESFEIGPSGAGGSFRAPLALDGLEPGIHRIDLGVAPLPGEYTTANNRASITLEVLEARARILYLDGGPRPEWRRMRKLWADDPSVELRSLLVDPLPEPHLPLDFPREIDALLEYDVLILGDVAPELFGAALESLLRDFVIDHGRTLVLLAGERRLPWAWRGTALEGLIPVILPDSEPPPDLGASLARDGPRLHLTAEGATSPLCRLVPGRSTNAELWGLLPGPFWVAPVPRSRPGTTTLVELEVTAHGFDPRASDPRDAGASRTRVPVFASRPSGAGNVFWAGIDSTWRWSFQIGNGLIHDFWRNVFRFAITERFPEGGDVALATDRAYYREGDPIRLRALVRPPIRGDARSSDSRKEGADAAQRIGRTDWGSEWVVVEIRARSEGEDVATDELAPLRIRLDPVPESAGRYEAMVPSDTVERWLAELARRGVEGVSCEAALHTERTGPEADSDSVTNARFAIALASRTELLDLTRNSALLEDIGRLSGGAAVPIENLSSAVEHFPGAPDRIEETRVRALADHPLAIAFLACGLLIAEWILRKKWSLV